MHVFIGGAFNGKRQYVKNWLAEREHVQYFEGAVPEAAGFTKQQTVVLANIEQLIYDQLAQDEVAIAHNIMEKLTKLAQTTQVICICTDQSRGVVPMDPQQRKFRDASGRLYQQLFEKSDTVTRIWYGLAQPLKGEHV